MRTLTINLTEEAYQALRIAVDSNDSLQEGSDQKVTVTMWLEEELNNNTEVIIEMLLADY